MESNLTNDLISRPVRRGRRPLSLTAFSHEATTPSPCEQCGNPTTKTFKPQDAVCGGFFYTRACDQDHADLAREARIQRNA